MKFRLLFLLSLLSAGLCAQIHDSIAINQVDSLIRVSRDLTTKREFEKAFNVNAAAEKIALDSFGRESAAYGSTCFNRGRISFFKRDYPEAEKWYLESKAIQENVLAKDHPDYALSLHNLALLYYQMGKYARAEPLFLESKAIREKVLGREHIDYAYSLVSLAALYFDIGNYEKAEPLHMEAKAIREKVLGKEHPDYISSLVSLGILYSQTGNNEKAESYLLEAKAISEKVLGKVHYGYARIIISLANHYNQLGVFENAEPLYLEARTIIEKALGKDRLEYARCLFNLAFLYREMGNYEKAEPLYTECKVIVEKLQGKDHPDYAHTLHNLAILYSDMGIFQKAEPLYIESNAIYGKAFGKEHPNYSSTLANLASLYFDMGNYKKAEQLYLESRTIYGKVLGEEHSDYAWILSCLADLYRVLGDYEKAEPLYLESKSIRQKVLGKEHPAYAWSLYRLAEFYESQNRFSESAPLLVEKYALDQVRLSRAISFLSERELAGYTATFKTNGDGLGSYILARLTSGAIGAEVKQLGILPALAFDHTLFYNGFLLTAAAQLNATAEGTPESKEISLRLKSYRSRLAAEYAKPIAERKDLRQLEEDANTAEKELSRSIAGYAETKRQVNWEELMSTLVNGEAALEFVAFKVNFPRITDSILYAALLLKPGAKQPIFIPLFEEKQLDRILKTSGEKKADYVNNLYALADRGAAPIEGPQRSLYELIWQPLEKELVGVQTIYFSPSGLLHRLNLGAIPISEEQTVADRYRLVELGSTRQLVIPTKLNPGLKDALLFGGIQYEVDSTFLAQTKQTVTNGDLASRGGLSFTNSDSTLRGGNWNYLRWTGKEVTGLEGILNSSGFQTTLRKGLTATEEEFKNIGQGKPSPRVLHLATHGYFFSDPKQENSRRVGLGESEPVFKMSEHPMIRSGLILAGGNHAWKQGKPAREGMEDGILTAYEISQMNLSNTELVVLSACETGLGDIQGNEGVYGLQRAFKIAGAKYLVMSLWQVPDQETSVFMTTFYKNWLEAEDPDKGGSKLTIPDAFRKTQQEMRERFINPYQWAGFVLVE